MTNDASQLRTRAGRILWRELPEEYRYRDRPHGEDDAGELGDLEAYLHGFGHLLDLIRATTEQAHADSFAEAVSGRDMQPWLVPYLAELLGAQLVAPDDAQRIEELNNSVGWYKSKGTLANVDNVADVVAGTETVAREGWRHVVITPRMTMPPFTSPPGTVAEDEAMAASMRPRGCPDFRMLNRAIVDEEGVNPLFKIKASRDVPESTDVHWRHWNPTGLPCFPGSYDDMTARTPDLRDPDGSDDIGPHPRRTLIHVRPPQGYFADSVPEIELNTLARLNRALKLNQPTIGTITAEDICEEFGLDPVPMIKLRTNRHINLNSGDFSFQGILFVGQHASDATKPVQLRCKKDVTLELVNCAAEFVSLAGFTGAVPGPQLVARNSLFGKVMGPLSFAEFEYVTSTTDVDLGRLNASDSILADLGDTLVCGGENPTSCLRFSAADFEERTSGTAKQRRDAAQRVRACLTGTNTLAKPNFIRLWHELPDGTCELRAAEYGEPGYGVLDLTTPGAILSGAEDDGEMGGHHDRFHAAAIRALQKKLTTFLPLGQEIAIFYDPMLVLSPPVLAEDKA